MAETTKEERMEVGCIWRDLNNLLRDREIEHVTEPRNLHSTVKFAEVGRKGFGLNFGKWRMSPVEDRLVVLLHEITHKVHGGSWGHNNHQPDFWDAYIQVYRKAYNHQEEIERIFGTYLDWKAVDYYMLDEISGSVDERIETAVERKEKMLPELVTPEDSLVGRPRIILDVMGDDHHYDNERLDKVFFRDIDFDRKHSLQELRQKLEKEPENFDWYVNKRRRDEGFSDSLLPGLWHWVEAPVIERSGDGYRVVKHNIVMEFMEETGVRKLDAEIM